MKSETIVYIIADDRAVRESLSFPLVREGFDIRHSNSTQAFLEAVTLDAIGCVLIDTDMKLDGFGLLTELKKHQLALPVIFVTAHADCPLTIQAMRAGAIDLLERPFRDEALVSAIHRALTRSDFCHVQYSEMQDVRARLATLTKREYDVFAALLKGQPNKVIAHELGISKKTVEVHRAKLMTKMGARSLAELLRIGLTAGRAGRR